ncbi:putative LRR receptor-like serine/threonine-protein kinase [Apostasia shenzhenica]|uniref:Putative LRR receptor-like serine/threonine-protein kinase n=1 Tax=Apostasia shenzhenica TaxID=1088818 RepID=A0A2I0B8C6_9ASPA|nr:putative LRR receptor-like serine/threonine-protein kinase [Apostasia shenzhenica]
MTCFQFFVKLKRSQQQQDLQLNKSVGNVKLFSFKELRAATGDFCPVNKVGEGGFGSVYKGTLRNGTNVAVKVLSTESKQGVKEFLTEITSIYNTVHENLVELYGCCTEGQRRILVYNYLENNSLAQTLLGANRSNIQFSWKTRYKISVGVARGLAFLHEEVEPHIVHRDIKASNILLDRDLTPKISDFGLAKLWPPNATHISTRVAGTIGYLAPEYAIRGQVTQKSDIYSFGILLLEIVSGRCNTNKRLPQDEQFLLERAWALYDQGELERIIDASLTEDLDIKQACKFLKVSLLCTQDSAKLRPSMSTVVKMLTGVRDVESEKITKPGLVSDFMEMKIHKKKANELFQSMSSSSNSSHCGSLGNTTCPSMTFTAIVDRE